MEWWRQVEAALLAGGGVRAPEWMDTEEVGEDGFLVAMPPDEKRADELVYAQEMDEQEREAEEDGDANRAAWARVQACEARSRAKSLGAQLTRSRASVKKPRPRGAGRPKVHSSSARRSSERSGDSGAEDDEFEPPQEGGRLCACGRHDISHKRAGALYVDDACRKRATRAAARARDALERPGVDRHRLDPYAIFEPGELDRLRHRVLAGCRCNGDHFADPEDRHCLKCGRQRWVKEDDGRGWWAFPIGFTVPAKSAETRRVRSSEVRA